MQSNTLSKEQGGPLKVLKESPPNCEAIVSNLSSTITREPEFYIRSHFVTPQIDASQWALEITLDDQRRKLFTYDQLSRMPQIEVAATLECAGNGRRHFGRRVEGEVEWGDGAVSTGRWRGVAVSEIINKVDLDSGELDIVNEFLFIGADGEQNDSIPLESKSKFVRSLPVTKAMDPRTIVALEMNGSKLPKDHGFPARLIVPGWFAMASVKWLSRIQLSTNPSNFCGHYNGVKYVYVFEKPEGEIIEPITFLKVKSLITSPQDGESLRAGVPTQVRGKAWSGSSKIAKVELDTGDGWKEAVLDQNGIGDFAWRSWKASWTPTKTGSVTLRVRATDESENVQPEKVKDNKYLYGYNGVHEVEVEVV
jgi:DMSO/TMAO reductase YedYZ molybdopterin-dependent catalytic subunit